MFRSGLQVAVGAFLLAWTGRGAEPARAPKLFESRPCPQLLIRGPERFSFNDDERTLICGDGASPAWSRVPAPEMERYLKVFLAGKGFHEVTLRQEKGIFVATVAPSTRLKEIVPTDEFGKILVTDRLRGYDGRRMTPDLLDELEGWARAELRGHGYACPDVRAMAHVDTGRLLIEGATGPKQKILSVNTEGLSSINPRVLRRFDSFAIGDEFDDLDLQLTKKRILDSEILSAVIFEEECTPTGVHLRQKAFEGGARIVRAGIGLNSERLFFLRAAWKNSRLGTNASQISIAAFTSIREQELSVEGDWYLGEPQSRRYIHSEAKLRHDIEKYHRYVSGSIHVAPAVQKDFSHHSLDMWLGPSLNFSHTYQGLAAPDSRFLTIDSRLRLLDHRLELNFDDPRTGHMLEFRSTSAIDELFSPVSATRLTLAGVSFWNLGNYSPPLLIAGIRSQFSTTITRQETLNAVQLPVEFLHHLGGIENLRTFARNELPGPAGGLTSFSLGVELRLTRVLPWGFEPLVFADLGKLGERSLSLGGPWYWGPGFGLRWNAPIGALWATLGHGFVEGQDDSPFSHWQFYFSFGRSF